MTASSTDLDIPQYTGSADDGPVEDWFGLFERHATAASWSEREKVANFNEYVTGEAFKFYLTHIFENNESWKKIKAEMTIRFKEYYEDSSTMPYQDKFQLGHHGIQQSSRRRHLCQMWPHIAKPSTIAPSHKPSEYKARIQTTSMNAQFPRDKAKSQLTERHHGRFPTRPDLPPGFSCAQRSSSPTSPMHYKNNINIQPPRLLDCSSFIRGPPPGFASRSSSGARNSHRTPHGIITCATDQMKYRENTLPSHCHAERVHASGGLCSIVQQSDTYSQLAKSPLPDKQDNTPCTSYLPDMTSTCEEKERHDSKRAPLIEFPEQHQEDQHRQVDENQGPQSILRQAQQPRKTSSKAQSQLKGRCRKASLLKQRQIQNVRHLRKKDRRQRCVLHKRSRLRLRLHHPHLRRHRERQVITPCPSQGLEHRPIHLRQRARKLKALPVCQSGQGMRHPPQPTFRCFKFYYYSVVTFPRTQSSSLSMCKASLSFPERNSQPRPPELSYISPDCCPLL